MFLCSAPHYKLRILFFLIYSSNFRESTDGRSLVVNFELPDVDKQDIHISFQRNKLVLTWETAEFTEWEEEDGIILREQVRRMYHRTLPLPDGTRVRGEIFFLLRTFWFSWSFPFSFYLFLSSSLKKSTLRWQAKDSLWDILICVVIESIMPVRQGILNISKTPGRPCYPDLVCNTFSSLLFPFII